VKSLNASAMAIPEVFVPKARYIKCTENHPISNTKGNLKTLKTYYATI